MELPDLAVEEALDKLGYDEVARIMRENYLRELNEAQDWYSTHEILGNTLRYIVMKHLDGDVERVSAGPSFKSLFVTLPSGVKIRGTWIINAAAKLERPDMTKRAAIRDLGNEIEVVRMMKERYLKDMLESQDWGSTYERLRDTLRYVVDTHLEGNLEGIGADRFSKKNFVLSTEKNVSGWNLISAVASRECPGMGAVDAIKKLGGPSAVFQIIKEKYLFSLDDTPESFVQAMKFMMDDEGEGEDEG
jgi:hypothetical protein